MITIITIKRLTTKEEAELLNQQFAAQYPWYRSGDYYYKCLEENQSNTRVTLLAYYKGELAGACHLLYYSPYSFFREQNIPEINDLNVFPEYCRNKIASKLFDELEQLASKTSEYIGLGVGLYKDYGNAQRMYTSRGYTMDGNGLIYNNIQVTPGEQVMVDDDLLLYLIKKLK